MSPVFGGIQWRGWLIGLRKAWAVWRSMNDSHQRDSHQIFSSSGLVELYTLVLRVYVCGERTKIREYNELCYLLVLSFIAAARSADSGLQLSTIRVATPYKYYSCTWRCTIFMCCDIFFVQQWIINLFEIGIRYPWSQPISSLLGVSRIAIGPTLALTAKCVLRSRLVAFSCLATQPIISLTLDFNFETIISENKRVFVCQRMKTSGS